MAHFYGTMKGNRGIATRCSTKQGGMDTYTASWQGAVHCATYHDQETGQDMVRVSLSKWHGAGSYCRLYDGPISGQPRKGSGYEQTAEELSKQVVSILQGDANDDK